MCQIRWPSRCELLRTATVNPAQPVNESAEPTSAAGVRAYDVATHISGADTAPACCQQATNGLLHSTCSWLFHSCRYNVRTSICAVPVGCRPSVSEVVRGLGGIANDPFRCFQPTCAVATGSGPHRDVDQPPGPPARGSQVGYTFKFYWPATMTTEGCRARYPSESKGTVRTPDRHQAAGLRVSGCQAVVLSTACGRRL